MGNSQSYENDMYMYKKKFMFYQHESEQKQQIIKKLKNDIKIMQNEINLLAKINKDLHDQLSKINDEEKLSDFIKNHMEHYNIEWLDNQTEYDLIMEHFKLFKNYISK